MNISYYWADKDERARIAQQHTKRQYDFYSKEIYDSVARTRIYDDNTIMKMSKDNSGTTVKLEAMGSVDAIFAYQDGKVAVLNFASYKNPGGKFLDGSRAQEECLCHESNLYNVLATQADYYAWNNAHKNRALYLNRALYSPDIIFSRPEVTPVKCDVITCAAPNITPSRKYGWGVTDEENTEALESRIKFVLGVAADQGVDTLILGAFGCGVFGQDATEVADLFIKYLTTTYSGCFKTVVFAIPQDVHGGNHDKFKRELDSIKCNK